MSETLKLADVVAANLPDWRMIRNALYATFTTGKFTAGLAFVQQIADAAEAANHHPDLTLTYPRVEVRLNSHDAGGVTDRDLSLARAISDLAAQAGHQADTQQTVVQMGLDTHDLVTLSPFWAAILDGKADGDEIFAGDRSPDVWFQESEQLPEPPPQRWHPDIWVPHDRAEERIKAALDAGGTLASDSNAPSYWVLADPDGNKVCICTNLER